MDIKLKLKLNAYSKVDLTDVLTAEDLWAILNNYYTADQVDEELKDITEVVNAWSEELENMTELLNAWSEELDKKVNDGLDEMEKTLSAWSENELVKWNQVLSNFVLVNEVAI